MNNSLIVDVGMHTGRDTEFYLKKGFNVIAIEANPKLVDKAKSLFQDYISNHKLIVYDVAIADREGTIDFYLNNEKDDWSTISPEYASRYESFATTNTLMQIKCTTFQSILRQHETPYYVKIDIEGADVLCLKSLMEVKEKPKYISVEMDLNSFENTFTELSLLWTLGYRKFKVVNQALNVKVRCPNPPTEGLFVDARFDGTCSGPFGEEAPGPWISVEETIDKYRRIITEQKYFGGGGKLYKTPFRKLYEVIKGEPVGWYDIHAKLGSP